MPTAAASATAAPITSTEDLMAAIETLAAKPGANFFNLRVQLPKEGKNETPMAATPRMWVSLKTYASGGENTMHAHLNEDHTFIVMQGEAEFEIGDQGKRIVGRHEGVLLPHGTQYCFQATGG